MEIPARNSLIILILILFACSKEEHKSLTGRISSTQHIVLTEGAMVTIQLLDISKQDVKANVITEEVIKNPGQFSINFDIQYNPDDIQPNNTYSLNVKVEDNDELLFITDKTYPVINNGVTDNIKINVVPADVAVQNETEVNLKTPKEIDAYINNMQLVPGYWEMGDASSVIEAYYLKDELKLIIEQMDMGDYGSSEYKYYFKDGYLFYHEQNGKRVNPGSDETADVTVVMLFNKEGYLVASRKTINFNPVELHDIEAPGVLKHCEIIMQIANQNFKQNL